MEARRTRSARTRASLCARKPQISGRVGRAVADPPAELARVFRGAFVDSLADAREHERCLPQVGPGDADDARPVGDVLGDDDERGIAAALDVELNPAQLAERDVK